MIKRLFFNTTSPQRRPRGTRPAKSPWRRFFDYGLTVALFGLLAVLATRLDRPQVLERQGHPIVNDGDSLTFGTVRVRLLGIDAPEQAQTCRLDGADYACGRRSREALARAIGAQAVSCSGSGHDRYGRLLAVCRVGEVELNSLQVRAGWAVAYGGYQAEEAKAKAARAGIWAGTFEKPQDWRRDHGVSQPPPGRNPLAEIGDRLRETLRFCFEWTYNLFVDTSGR